MSVYHEYVFFSTGLDPGLFQKTQSGGRGQRRGDSQRRTGLGSHQVLRFSGSEGSVVRRFVVMSVSAEVVLDSPEKHGPGSSRTKQYSGRTGMHIKNLFQT